MLTTHTIYYFSMVLIGLAVGSFLNVVIVRLPKMMLHPESNPHFNLFFPRSHCTNCLKAIAPFENIPLFSYLYLKGKCRYCKQGIALRYPLVEALTACLTLAVVWRFGWTFQALFGLLLSWALIVCSTVDLDHLILPDSITQPFLWLGLLLSLEGVFQSPENAILGAVLGYGVLWSIYWIFKGLTGKEGLGQGDFKLLAMLGAWLGWKALPFIILCASSLGTLAGLSWMVFRKKAFHTPIPFGPFLAVAGWIALLWGPELNAYYLEIFNR